MKNFAPVRIIKCDRTFTYCIDNYKRNNDDVNNSNYNVNNYSTIF